MREFWIKNGFVIASEQPTLGIMETDWAENRAAVPQDFLQRFMSKYVSFMNDTYKRDKFRTRIERGTEPGTVEIFISHRGAAQQPTKTNKGSRRGLGSVAAGRRRPQPRSRISWPHDDCLRRARAEGDGSGRAAEQRHRARLHREGQGRRQASSSSTMPSIAPGAASASRSTAPASRWSIATARRVCISCATRTPTSTSKKEKGWLDKLAFWKSDDAKPEQYRVVVTQADPQQRRHGAGSGGRAGQIRQQRQDPRAAQRPAEVTASCASPA